MHAELQQTTTKKNETWWRRLRKALRRRMAQGAVVGINGWKEMDQSETRESWDVAESSLLVPCGLRHPGGMWRKAPASLHVSLPSLFVHSIGNHHSHRLLPWKKPSELYRQSPKSTPEPRITANMKLAPYFIVLILGLLQGALAVKAQHKSVIISFPDDTPDTVMLDAKRTIRDAVSALEWTNTRSNLLTPAPGWLDNSWIQ